jgi:hypothetical protein
VGARGKSSMSYNLFFDDEFLGTITEIDIDDFWQLGVIAPTQAIIRFRDLFDYLTDESGQLQPPENFEDVVSGNHWFVKDDLGRKRPIDIPAIYRDNEIRWQWTQWESE